MTVLSAPETVRLLSGHILPRSESNFTHSHLDFKKFSSGETPWTLAYRSGEGKGLKAGFIPLKEVQGKGQGRGDRDRRGKGREGICCRGDLAPTSQGGIDAPVFAYNFSLFDGFFWMYHWLTNYDTTNIDAEWSKVHVLMNSESQINACLHLTLVSSKCITCVLR